MPRPGAGAGGEPGGAQAGGGGGGEAWCVVRGAWCVARGAWCVARGAWRVARGAWRVARGAWRVARGAWRVARGAWRVARGAWRVARGASALVAASHNATACRLYGANLTYATLPQHALDRVNGDLLLPRPVEIVFTKQRKEVGNGRDRAHLSSTFEREVAP